MAEYKHGEMDIDAHNKTFHGFMKFTTWVVIALLLVLVFLAIFAT